MDEIYLTPEVRRAEILAQYEAERSQHTEPTLAHYLLGLIHADNESGRHVLSDLSFQPSKVQQLIQSLPIGDQHSPTQIYSSSIVEHIRKTGIEQARYRGHTYLGIEHLVLAIAIDQAGGDLLRQLQIPSEQVQSQIERLLQEAPISISEYPFSFEQLNTPDHMIDLRKLITRCRYPLYGVVNPSLAFHLCKTELGIDNGILNEIFFEFARPFCWSTPSNLKHIQIIGISNLGRTSSMKEYAWLTALRLNPRMITKGLLQSPPQFRGMLDVPFNQVSSKRWLELFTNTTWEIYNGSDLHFKTSFWEGGDVPVGWAYSEEEEPLVTIGTLGVSRSDFLEVLKSLVILEPENESLLEKLQEEMKIGHQEFLQYQKQRWGS